MTKGCRPRRGGDKRKRGDRTGPGFLDVRRDLVRLRRDRSSRRKVDKRIRDDRTVPVLPEAGLAISFTVTARDPGSRARTGTIATERGDIRPPAVLPVGTAATVKGGWPSQLKGG